MPVIIAGKRKGAKLLVPEGDGVRPTLVRVREALFSMLFSEMGTFEGCRILDPFAGAGLLGLEAWSRGAAHVDFMEQSRAHFNILNKNIDSLKARSETTACLGRSPQDWPRFSGRYDIVLCDPPYADNVMPDILRRLTEQNRLNPAALVSEEHSAGDSLEIPPGYILRKNKTYGKCRILLLQAAPIPETPSDSLP